ncbi:MAG TPA: hypothetical protein VK466_07115, partial [Terriglobales bacterium]|nr:hypothetical protein [Terriglobales bacterium]
RLANGGGRDELLLSAKDERGIPATLSWPQWSPDGKYLVYVQQSGPTGASIWFLPLSPAGQPQLLVKPETPAGKVISASLSPDGRWLAYSANDGIREEIYVTAFPSGGGRWQITREGGTDPSWRADGKEIFNIGSDSKLYATEVNPRADQVEVGKSVPIFDVRNVFPLGAPYNASPDGKTFLLLTQPEASVAPMELVLNWNAELK